MSKHEKADQEAPKLAAENSAPSESPMANAEPWYRKAELWYGGATVLGGLAVFFWVVGQLDKNPLPVDARIMDPPVAPLAAVEPTIIEHPDEPDTNSYPVVAVEAPPPPQIKLQGIFYNPQNPSAILDGRTVFLGDRVTGGFRVIAISPTNVTLGSATETNVLSLSGR